MPIGAYLSADSVGSQPKLVLRDLGIYSGVAVLLAGSASASDWTAIAFNAFMVGIPVLTGVSAAIHTKENMTMNLSPVVSPQYKGVVTTIRF